MSEIDYYIFDEKVVDATKCRAEAIEKSQPNRYGDKPRDVTIHWHSLKETCNKKEGGQKHEYYPASDS